MQCEKYVVNSGLKETRNGYEMLVGKSEGKLLENLRKSWHFEKKILMQEPNVGLYIIYIKQGLYIIWEEDSF